MGEEAKEGDERKGEAESEWIGRKMGVLGVGVLSEERGEILELVCG